MKYFGRPVNIKIVTRPATPHNTLILSLFVKMYFIHPTDNMIDYIKAPLNYLRWELCPETGKIEVCPSNLIKLSGILAVSVTGGVVAGTYALPWLGFDVSGVGATTFAAGWQAGIGNIVAGSPFAILQSLAATGKGAILFGGVGAGLGGLASLVAAKKIDWCACQYNSGKFTYSKL